MGGALERLWHLIQQEDEADELLYGRRVADRLYRENRVTNIGGFDWLTV